MIIPDSFTGSNLRNNSLLKGAELEERNKQPVEKIAEAVMKSADRRAQVTYIPNKAWLLSFFSNAIEPFSPSFTNYAIGKNTRPKL